MFNIDDLIAQIKAAASVDGAVTVNININQPTVNTPVVDDVVVDDAPVALPDTDFDIDDRVLVCHICKDGVTRKHTMGTVIEVQGQDDKGFYTRVLGDNGKHYCTGLKYNEERLGSMIVMLDEDCQ